MHPHSHFILYSRHHTLVIARVLVVRFAAIVVIGVLREGGGAIWCDSDLIFVALDSSLSGVRTAVMASYPPESMIQKPYPPGTCFIGLPSGVEPLSRRLPPARSEATAHAKVFRHSIKDGERLPDQTATTLAS